MVKGPTKSASAVMQAESNILAALEEHGSRMTWPRRQMARMLARRTDSFSAEEIVAELPTLGRATVYRTLRLLGNAGVLCKTNLPDGSPRYSLDDAHHHHHLVCVGCERIEEFRHPSIERMLRAMKAPVGSELIGHRLELYHRCAGCRESGQGGEDIHVHGAHVHTD
ncbi:MAG: Fur family transcriptional regulator [Chloroflexota bacterium]|nr:Fur family transcriptional regulator [Chloroflexota bacterium]MDE2886032.1 Fur family transcriptional regulator [Chloroflexota bacterium]